MKTIKKILTVATLSGVIMMGVQKTQAGIIVNLADESKAGVCQNNPEKNDENKDWGIIVNLTGIIVNLTGIIVNFSDDAKTTTDCGIIVN